MSATESRIDAVLLRVRRGLRGWAAARGAAILASALVGAIALSYLLDHELRLDRLSRGIVGAALLAALALLARTVLLRPLRAPVAADDLALALERRFPRLGERLVSAVQFRRRLDEPSGTSPALMRRVVDLAEGEVGGLAVRRLFRTRAILRLGLAGGSAVVGLAVLAALFPDHASLWLRRSLLLSAEPWPRATTFVVEGFEGGSRRVPRGDGVAVVARAVGEVPRRVEVRYEFDGGIRGEATCSELADGRYRHVFRDLVEPLRFCLVGGDGEAGPFRIEVVDRPSAEWMRLGLTFPAYLRRAPAVHDVVSGGLTVPEGTEITARARTRGPVVSAVLVYGSRDLGATLTEGRDVAASFRPEESGLLALSLVDEEGFAADLAVTADLRVEPDRAPRATLRASEIGSSVTPEARLPLEVRVEDDHGLTAAALRRTVIRPGEEPVSSEGDPVPELSLGGTEAEGSLRRDLEPLALEPGSTLRLVVAVRDDDGLHGPKEGLSEPLTLRIVSREDLLAEMIRRQQEVRRDLDLVLEGVVADREDLSGRADAIVEEPPADATRRALFDLARAQRRSGRRTDELADRFERILLEMRHNRLVDDAAAAALSVAVPRPMRRLASGPFPASADRVEEAAREETATARAAAHATARRGYDQVIGELQRILEALRRAEGFTELVERLRQVARLESEVRAATEAEYRKRIRDLFPDDEGRDGRDR